MSEATKSPVIRTRVRSAAVELLGEHPPGLRFSELHRLILRRDSNLKPKTISSAIWNLDVVCPDKVYKPSKGLYRLIKYRDAAEGMPVKAQRPRVPRPREDEFYPLFAAWLKYDLEEVTHAIALGGNAFRDRWGTPDVLAKNESRRSDVIKAPTTIVSAEIKTDTAGLVTGFGQACAYRLFSHKSYLAIPRQTPAEEMARIDALCSMFGIGLVTFDPRSLAAPDFRLVVRPLRHEPDLQYTNKYIRHVEKELFS